MFIFSTTLWRNRFWFNDYFFPQSILFSRTQIQRFWDCNREKTTRYFTSSKSVEKKNVLSLKMDDFYLNKMSCYNLLMKVAISRMECVVIHVHVKLSMCIWILFRLKVSYSIQSTKNRNTLNNSIRNSSQIGHSEFHMPHNYHTPHTYSFYMYLDDVDTGIWLLDAKLSNDYIRANW